MKKVTAILFLSLSIFTSLNAEENNTSINENKFYNELLIEEKTQEKENRMFIELVNNFKDILTENIKLTNEKLKSDLEIEKLKFEIKKLKNVINEKDIEIKILKSNLKNSKINMKLKEQEILKDINKKKQREKEIEMQNKELTILQLQNKLKVFKEKYKNKNGYDNDNLKICEVKNRAVNLRKSDSVESPIIRKHYKGDLLKVESIEENWIKTDKGYVFKTLCKIL